ncbi:MAG: hypothetical protein B0W54_13090 [Cellvibrio sp. 79]|nr:MAG: hypothetical protein B0W54_13090 [Cellvibrio sp. 79]
MNPVNVKIKIGEQGAQFLQRNNLPANQVTKQPAGLNFYRYRWPASIQGVAIVEHGAYGFQVPHALSIVGMEDVDHLDEGLADFTINAGITAADTLSHDEARREFITLLQKLLALGWKPLISYNYPRLSGEEAFRYYEEDDSYGIPPNYVPTLEQWMRIDFDNWYLYADNVFLEIKFRRGDESKDPAMAAYLIIFNIHSREAEAKAQFEGEEREHWQDLWMDKIKSLKKERYAKEAELTQRGFTIYTEYEEPKIHPADPVEP